MYIMHPFFQKWLTATHCLIQPMAKLLTMKQHLERQPPTVVSQTSTWWETVLAHVKLQESGLGVNPPVNVCCYLNTLCSMLNIT